MKSLIKLSWLFLLVGLTLVSCRDDKDVTVDPPVTIPVTPPKIDVNASVFGLVKDQSGNAIADAKVRIDGNTITQTDVNGAFVTSIMTLNQYGSNIVVEKSGYFLGSKFVQPKDGDAVYSEMTLVNRTLSGSVDGAAGGTVTANGGATIELSANGIKDADGNVYTGQVNVYAHWYDPAGANLVNEMPGDLRAVNSNNQFQQLATYGMMAVELESGNGSPLNIAAGQTAALSFPVPSTMDGAAPASIPLWFFDEASGYWLEDGSATKVGSSYSAEVSHFTWWNCDVPFDFVDLSGTITDVNGNAWSNARILFTDSNALNGYAYTDLNGYYSLKVPKNEPLTMEIKDRCGDILQTENIGPYSADATHDVQLSTSAFDVLTITATLEACAGNPALSEAYFKIEYGNGAYNILSIDATGYMSYTFSNCAGYTSATITGVDFDNNMFSTPVTMSLPASGIIDFGSFVACAVNLESWIFSVDANSGYAVDMNIGEDGGLNASGWGPDSNSVYFQIQSFTGVGSYEPSSLNVSVPIGVSNWDYIYCQACPDVTINITQYGAIGERVIGNWSGFVLDNQTGLQKNTTGDFDLIRDY